MFNSNVKFQVSDVFKFFNFNRNGFEWNLSKEKQVKGNYIVYGI